MSARSSGISMGERCFGGCCGWSPCCCPWDVSVVVIASVPIVVIDCCLVCWKGRGEQFFLERLSICEFLVAGIFQTIIYEMINK